MSYTNPGKAPSAGTLFLSLMLAGLILTTLLLIYWAPLGNSYVGIGFLLAIPFCLGGLVTGIGGFSFETAGCIFAPIILFAILFPLAYFGFGEGIVCILMVLPIWLAAGLGGGIAAWIINRRLKNIKSEGSSTKLNVSILLTIPFLLIFYEETSPPAWQTYQVTRSIEIDASAAKVYPSLIALPQINGDEGKATFTHSFLDIPRPSKAQIVKRNGQLIRAAQWGKDIGFEEHITHIKPLKEIRWRFVFPDDSVQNHTDKHIAPDGPIVKITTGGYTISDKGNDKVQLTLSTQYQMRSQLDWYFKAWGELFLGDIQSNVLTIIKQRSEKAETSIHMLKADPQIIPAG